MLDNAPLECGVQRRSGYLRETSMHSNHSVPAHYPVDGFIAWNEF